MPKPISASTVIAKRVSKVFVSFELDEADARILHAWMQNPLGRETGRETSLRGRIFNAVHSALYPPVVDSLPDNYDPPF